MKYHIAAKKNELLTHTTTWMNFKSLMLQKRSQPQERTLHDSIHVKLEDTHLICSDRLDEWLHGANRKRGSSDSKGLCSDLSTGGADSVLVWQEMARGKVRNEWHLQAQPPTISLWHRPCSRFLSSSRDTQIFPEPNPLWPRDTAKNPRQSLPCSESQLWKPAVFREH